MGNTLSNDEIDKIVDTLLQRLDLTDINVSRELTYVSTRKIAERLGIATRTCSKWIKRGTILTFVKYRGRRMYRCTNETLLRESMVAWCQAARILCRASAAPREGKAELTDTDMAR